MWLKLLIIFQLQLQLQYFPVTVSYFYFLVTLSSYSVTADHQSHNQLWLTQLSALNGSSCLLSFIKNTLFHADTQSIVFASRQLTTDAEHALTVSLGSWN